MWSRVKRMRKDGEGDGAEDRGRGGVCDLKNACVYQLAWTVRCCRGCSRAQGGVRWGRVSAAGRFQEVVGRTAKKSGLGSRLASVCVDGARLPRVELSCVRFSRCWAVCRSCCASARARGMVFPSSSTQTPPRPLGFSAEQCKLLNPVTTTEGQISSREVVEYARESIRASSG